MKRPRAGLVLSALLATGTTARVAAAAEREPWSDDDGLSTSTRHEFGDYGLQVGAEYRANWLYVRPISLNSTTQRNASWVEQRLRLDLNVDYSEKVRLVISADALDGVLWGDNGTFGGDPPANSGSRAASSIPNEAHVGVGYLGQGDVTDANNYGYVLQPTPPITFRRAYGEVMTPVGILRIGRQPTTEGTSLLVADGDGRANRWGYAGRGDSVDRILFGTKPLEAFKAKAERDLSREHGVFLGVFYDFPVQNRVQYFGDDLHAFGTALIWKKQEPGERDRFEAQGTFAHRWEREYDTDINIFALRAMGRIGHFYAGAEAVHVGGGTTEVSEALRRITADPKARQTVDQWGARGVARWDELTWTAYLEADFASSDRDPSPGSTLSQLYFAEDANVGLLMFERVLQFASARSAYAGVELLRQLNAPSYPIARVDTQGSFTQAIALYPQFDFRPREDLLLRGGVLTAWAPVGLVDPARSLQNKYGNSIENDLVNFNGGRPGNFYGVELDGRVRWTYHRFLFDLESAVLFPGEAFWDENHQAARSFLLQGRTTFVF